MRVIRMLVLAVLAACASAPRGAPGLEGTYQMEEVNGRALPAPPGVEDGVMLHEGTLALHPGDRYALRMVAAVPGQAGRDTAEVAGSYRVFGDSLALTPDPRPDSDDEEVRFRWTLEGARLRLFDDAGDEYTFVRR